MHNIDLFPWHSGAPLLGLAKSILTDVLFHKLAFRGTDGGQTRKFIYKRLMIILPINV